MTREELLERLFAEELETIAPGKFGIYPLWVSAMLRSANIQEYFVWISMDIYNLRGSTPQG